jgi:Cu/Ag efflux pump CusA
MTALATGLALVPIIVGGNRPGHEIEHPMAVVIVGGIVTSTFLNLFIMPALYLLIASPRQGRARPTSRRWRNRLRARLRLARRRLSQSKRD